MTNAALIYEIDSSQAAKAAGDLGKLEKATGSLAGKYDSLAKSVARAELNPKRFSSTQINAFGKRVDSLVSSFNAVDAAAGAASLKADQFGRSMSTAGMQTANVFAQLNDIGVMLAAGQNPIQLALQQGTQLNQVWTSMGAQGKTLGGVAGVLRGAFASMINPMSLLTIGTIAAAGALVQWVTAAWDASESNKSLSEQYEGLAGAASAYADAVRLLDTPLVALNEKFGTQAQKMRELYEVQARLQRLEFMQSLKSANQQLVTSFGGLIESVERLETALNWSDAFREDKVMAISEEMRRLNNEFGIGSADARTFARELQALATATGPEEAADLLQKVVERLVTAKERGADVPPELIRVAQEAANAAGSVLELTSALQAAGTAAANVTLPVSAGMTYGNGNWAAGLYGDDLLPPTRKKPKATGGGRRGGGGGGGRAVEQAQKQFQTLRELLEKESMFEFAEWEKRQGQLDNALSKKLLSVQKYEEMKRQLQTFYFGTDAEISAIQYQMDLEALNLANEQKLISEEAYLIKRRQLQDGYYSGMIGSQQSNLSSELSSLGAHFGQMNSLAGGGFEKLLRAQQTFAAASATIDAYRAAVAAMADPNISFMGRLMAYGKVLAAGLGAVRAIKGPGRGGAGGGASVTSAATASAPPPQVVTLDVQGNGWAKDLVENVIMQIQEQTKDGRIVYRRAR